MVNRFIVALLDVIVLSRNIHWSNSLEKKYSLIFIDVIVLMPWKVFCWCLHRSLENSLLSEKAIEWLVISSVIDFYCLIPWEDLLHWIFIAWCLESMYCLIVRVNSVPTHPLARGGVWGWGRGRTREFIKERLTCRLDWRSTHLLDMHRDFSGGLTDRW